MKMSGVKVFSASKPKEREEIGTNITAWLGRNPKIEIIDKVVIQSSDATFHCLSVVLFYEGQQAEHQLAAPRTAPRARPEVRQGEPAYAAAGGDRRSGDAG